MSEALVALAFPVVWLTVCGFISAAAGHPRALALYPPTADRMLASHWFASAVGPGNVRFKGALYVGIGERGLHIAPNFVFRPPWWWGVPCIPWSAVTLLGQEPFYFTTRTRIEVQGIGTWLVGGRAGRDIAERVGR